MLFLPRLVYAIHQAVEISTIEHAAMSSAYTNLPLQDAKDIRLLSLWPAENHDDLLIGELSVVDVTNSDAFEALSYTWDPPFDEQILEDDEIELPGTRLRITGNLSHALRRLRSGTRPRVLWIDAICINQSDIKERGHQVGIMADIFGSATRVLAWLGEDTEKKDGEYVLKYRCSIERYCRAMNLDYVTLSRDRGRRGGWALPRFVEELFETFGRRRYFARRWVVQEQFVAREVLFVCGAVDIGWNDFWRTISAPIHLRPVWVMYNCFDRFHTNFRPSVLDTLESFQTTQCSDARDLLIAMSCFWTHLDLQMDYTMSISEVYVTFAKAILRRASKRVSQSDDSRAQRYPESRYTESDLAQLLLVAAFQASAKSFDRLLPELPSWVPDWRQKMPDDWYWHGHEYAVQSNMKLAAKLVNGDGLEITLACYGELCSEINVNLSPCKHFYVLLLDGQKLDITVNEILASRCLDEHFAVNKALDNGCILCTPFWMTGNDLFFGIILQPMHGTMRTFKIVGQLTGDRDFRRSLARARHEERVLTIV